MCIAKDKREMEKDSIQLDSTKGLNDLAMTELKEKYATGEYDCYINKYENDHRGNIPTLEICPTFGEYHFTRYKLIKKKHSHIAQTVIENPDVKLTYRLSEDSVMRIVNANFFESYCDEAIYSIEEPFTVTETKEDTKSITDDDGTIYEFEKPEFECELLKYYKQNEKIYGVTFEKEGIMTPHMWDKYGMSLVDKDHNLTPIKSKKKNEVRYSISLGYLKELFKIKQDISRKRTSGIVYTNTSEDTILVKIIYNKNSDIEIEINNDKLDINNLITLNIIDCVGIEFYVPANSVYNIKCNITDCVGIEFYVPANSVYNIKCNSLILWGEE